MAIKPKELDNPKLSPEMQSIIKRSHGEVTDGERYDDVEMYKDKIMLMLIADKDLIETLHNEDIPSETPDAYRDVNIFNFLKIPGTQSTVKNFVCFEVNDVELPRYSEGKIIRHIIFKTYSHEDDVKTDYGIARQDLLGLIVKSKFDWSQAFGMHLEKVQDYGKTTENGYYYREIVYETIIANNLVNKALNGGGIIGRNR